MTAMTIATAASCLRECIEADIPAFLWGAPGIGKSQAIDQVAASLNMPVIDWRANLRDPVDVRGLPVTDIKAGVTRWLCPHRFAAALRVALDVSGRRSWLSGKSEHWHARERLRNAERPARKSNLLPENRPSAPGPR